MDERQKLISLMEEISGNFNLDLKTEDVKELIAVIDEELDNCIRKLRNAVYGREVRTFITEYEELMLKKSDLVTWEFLKREKEEQMARNEEGQIAHKEAEERISDYKKYILVYLRQLWKSKNTDIWCGLYTFIKRYTENERRRLPARRSESEGHLECHTGGGSA